MQDPIDTIETDTDEPAPEQGPPELDDMTSDPLIASFAAALSWAERNIQPVRQHAQADDVTAAVPDDVPRFKVMR